MKNEWKVEWYRAVHSAGFWGALLIGCLIGIAHFLFCIIPLNDYVYMPQDLYPLSAYGKWMGMDNITVYSSLYYFILPILVSLPFTGSMKEDIQSGYIRNVVIRVEKWKYFAVKFGVTFVISGLTAVLPLILNFVLTATVLPLLLPQSNTATYPIFQYCFLGDYYYQHPFGYVCIFLLLTYVFMGLLAVTGLLASYICRNVFTVVLTPFMIHLLSYAFTQITGWNQICPYAFLRPGQPVAADFAIITAELCILLAAGGIYFYVSKKQEIY